MISYRTIWNKSQLKEYVDYISEMRLPLNIATESVQAVRSLPINNYLWGIVYTYIAEATGSSPEEVHEGYKRKFRFRGDFVYNKEYDRYDYVIGTQSTTKDSNYELWQFTLRIRADAEIEHHIVIPMPNETFLTDELKFE